MLEEVAGLRLMGPILPGAAKYAGLADGKTPVSPVFRRQTSTPTGLSAVRRQVVQQREQPRLR